MSKKLLRKKLALMLANLKKKRKYYCEVEYLESSGTQYIDTGFNVDDTCGYKVVYMALDSNDRIIFGTKGANNSRWVLSGANNPTVNLSWNASNGFNCLGLNKVQVAQMNFFNDRKRFLNGTEMTAITETLDSSAGTFSVCAFAGYWGYSTASLFSSCRIYRATITKGNAVVVDLIPVLDWNMTPCMYDRVTDKLFYNAGSGNFTAGREIHQVEYIETDGTSYINTRYTPSGSTETEITTMLKDQTYSRFMFGCRSAQSNKTYACLAHNSNRIGYRVGDGSYIYSNDYNELNTKHTYKIANGVFYRDDVVINTACQGATVSPNSPLVLLTINTNNVLDVTQPFVGNFYSCTIKDNNVLVRDYIPAIDENGVGFAFDRVSHTIFDNAGTGAFGYSGREVEYLESTGTQYIDTGVYPTQLTEVEYRCAVTGSVSNVDSHLFGSRLSASSEAFDFAYMNTQPNGIEKFRFIHGTTTTQETTTSVTASQLANPHTYYMSGTSFKVDGSEKMSFTTSSFTGTYSLWLFGVNNAGSLHNQVRAQRVYKCPIWDNGVPVRDFYPVFKDGVLGMLDKVNNVFYPNAGTGTFVGGLIVEPEYE